MNGPVLSPIVLVICSMLILMSCAKEDCDALDNEPVGSMSDTLYTFFVAGHTYGAPGVNNVGLHPPFEDNYSLIIEEGHLEFGVLTGDIVMNSTVADWEEVDQSLAALPVPVHFAPGNHDLTDPALYLERYGETYGYFWKGNDLHIFLNGTVGGWNIVGDQLAFLTETLSETAESTQNIFVHCHQLIWWTPDNQFSSISVNSTAGRASESNFESEVLPLFDEVGERVTFISGDVSAFATGDEFVYVNEGRITYIASGMGGGERDNFILVDIDEFGIAHYRLIALNGNDITALGNLEDYVLE